MTIEETAQLMAAQLAAIHGCSTYTPPTTEKKAELSGQHIVVLDRGLVYVGDVSRVGDFLRIDNARNIRVWGTTKGLGELVNGPTPKTVLDSCGEVMAPAKAVICLLKSKGF